MKYSKSDIGILLKSRLDRGYNVTTISDWADDILMIIRDDISTEIDDILDRIALMDAGPEFVYSEKDLRLLADLLIKEESEPFERLHEIEQKSQ